MKHSVWLCPSAEDAPRLQQLIARCAAAFDSPAFPPHITLCSEPVSTSVAGSGLELELPIRLSLASVGFGADYFHACYLLLRDSAAVLGLQARSATVLRGRTQEQYPPHLSLAYGALSEEQRQRVAELVAPLPFEASFDHIEVWQTSGAVEGWRQRATTAHV